MDIGFEQQFHRIVLPAWEAYNEAEDALTQAHATRNEATIEKARFRALREGGAAAFYLNHFVDIVAAERPAQLPAEARGVRGVRDWVKINCFQLRTDERIDDVQLIADVADALKHAKLRDNNRQIEANDAVLIASLGWGQGRYSEGKYGGPEQIVILAKSGTRVLSAVLQNVVDAWRVSMGWPLPPINQVYRDE